jgi:hypothetical protein
VNHSSCPITFLRSVAEAVVDKGLDGLTQMMPGDAYACAVAEATWDKYRQRVSADVVPAELQQLAQVNQAQVREVAAAAVQGLVAPPNALLALQQFLTAIPAATRQSLKRSARRPQRQAGADEDDPGQTHGGTLCKAGRPRQCIRATV